MPETIDSARLVMLTGTTVLVAGDMILDVTLYGDIERISPEAPVPVLKARESIEKPGGAANVAMNIRALGGVPILVGRIGRDRHGATLKRLLKRAGISTEGLIESRVIPTIRKTRVVARNQQVLRVDHETIAALNADEVRRARAFIGKWAPRVHSGVFSDYSKGLAASLAEGFVAAMKKARAPFVVDPKPASAGWFAGAYLVCPNHWEAEAISGAHFRSDEDVARHGQGLRRKLRAKYLLVTRGADGMSLVMEQAIRHYAVARREVYDVTGAGDTVSATLATALGAGFSVDEAVRLANVAAGVVIQKAGTATATPAEIVALARGHRAKTMPLKALLPVLARLRGAGQRSVFTNGVFDLLHPGHLQYLQAAKALGDVLVVGVNSDESARRLKGPGRPINPLGFRLEMLSGFQCVDFIVSFGTRTPLPLIRAIRPDVLVKGGDYTPETVVGKEFVESYGGKVAIVSFLEGYSSTDLIRKIESGRNRR
jgi:D-beta-D-heptose 7-phosphate kinase/D-beta-D-heptose 1-phosphate adenosyltransferase